jgi:SAM-dependent methyltransferase
MDGAEAFNAFEAAGWERQVQGYEEFFVPITGRLAGPLLDAARVGPGTVTLDVASGPGHIAAAAARRGASVTGVDVAEGMLARAREAHPEVRFLHGDAEALPFDDASFDAVVAGFVLLHLGRPERAAAEFARVLRPGGRVALAMWDFPDRARFIGVLLEATAEVGAAPPPGMPAGPPSSRACWARSTTWRSRPSGSRCASAPATCCGAGCWAAPCGSRRSCCASRRTCRSRSAPPSIGSSAARRSFRSR